MGMMNYTYNEMIEKLKKLWYIFHKQAAWSHEFCIHKETD
jgi:hypothetical protein